MEMNGRGFHGDYRFGYQGSEKDNEVSGDGNSYTTEFRQLDPRLGRWFSVDPVFQPWQSPYTSMDNNPIGLNDPKGLDPKKEKNGKTSNDGEKQKSPSKIKEVFTRAYRYVENRFYHYTGQQYKNDAYADADKRGISRKDVVFGKDKETGQGYADVRNKEKVNGVATVNSHRFWSGGKRKDNSDNKSNTRTANNSKGFLSPVGNGLKWLDNLLGNGGMHWYVKTDKTTPGIGEGDKGGRKGNKYIEMIEITDMLNLLGGTRGDAGTKKGAEFLSKLTAKAAKGFDGAEFLLDYSKVTTTIMESMKNISDINDKIIETRHEINTHWGGNMYFNGKLYQKYDTMFTIEKHESGKLDTTQH